MIVVRPKKKAKLTPKQPPHPPPKHLQKPPPQPPPQRQVRVKEEPVPDKKVHVKEEPVPEDEPWSCEEDEPAPGEEQGRNLGADVKGEPLPQSTECGKNVKEGRSIYEEQGRELGADVKDELAPEGDETEEALMPEGDEDDGRINLMPEQDVTPAQEVGYMLGAILKALQEDGESSDWLDDTPRGESPIEGMESEADDELQADKTDNDEEIDTTPWEWGYTHDELVSMNTSHVENVPTAEG